MRFQLAGVAFAAEASDLPWTPVYSTVAGTLLLDDLPVHGGDTRYSFVQFDLDVQQAGTVVLAVNVPDGVSAWVGAQPVEPVTVATCCEMVLTAPAPPFMGSRANCG